MKADYTRWRQRLAGEKVVTYTEPDEADVGFYRLPIKERKQNAAGQNNGQWKTIGFKPVALFVQPAIDGALVCQIGAQVVDEDRRNDAWTSFVRHPITEEVWRAVVENDQPWPDFQEPATCDRCGGHLGANHACIPEPPTFENGNPDIVMEPKATPIAPQDTIKQRLATLKAQVAAFAKIESDEQSSAARGLQAKFLEVRGEAAGHYETANRPLLDQQKKLREIWFPLRDEADEAKTALGDAMGLWEDVKRAAAKRAEEATKRLQEQAKRDAEWKGAEPGSIAHVDPEPVKPVASNAPPPAAQIKAAGARTANVKLAKIVTEIDVDKAFAQFRLAPEVREVLMSLAQRAVTAGLPVDGATIEEKSKVR